MPTHPLGNVDVAENIPLSRDFARQRSANTRRAGFRTQATAHGEAAEVQRTDPRRVQAQSQNRTMQSVRCVRISVEPDKERADGTKAACRRHQTRRSKDAATLPDQSKCIPDV